MLIHNNFEFNGHINMQTSILISLRFRHNFSRRNIKNPSEFHIEFDLLWNSNVQDLLLVLLKIWKISINLLNTFA